MPLDWFASQSGMFRDTKDDFTSAYRVDYIAK